MLKIKEDRMQELEKFGFILKYNNLIHLSYYVRPVDEEIQKAIKRETLSVEQARILECNDVIAIVNKTNNPFWDRGIFLIKKGDCYNLDCPFSDEITPYFIEDLIKADMVEKDGEYNGKIDL